MINRKTALLIGLSALLLSAMIAPVMAGPSDVVINVGDWFKYECIVTKWESTDPFLPEGYWGSLLFTRDNATNYILYSVTDITPSGDATNVTFLVTVNWKNGSETTETMVESVSNATMGQGGGHWIPLIGADMSPGEVVSDTFDFGGFGLWDYPQRYINRTFDFTNPSSTRATNECNYTFQIFSGDSYDIRMWWDKATGMSVYYENHGNVTELFTAAYNYTFVQKLVDSSINDIAYVPEVFTTAVMLGILSASTVAIVLYKRKRLLIKT